ncbi:LOW QUALITY PROTEIN: N-lysine methyltransferase KMT5A-A-like, partial [Menidia menidia]
FLQNCISKVQSNFQSLQSSSKPRSPLSDSLIKEGNDSDATNPDMSKLKKGAIFRTENKAPQNRKVTDYFPIRRSNRKTKTELKSEEHKHLDDLINNGTEEGMEVKHIEGKGRGVFAIKGFKKGEYVVEYHGDLLDLSQAKMREAEYAEDPQTGCYMYYFQQSKTYCVDATKETGRLGRLINHSKNGNCQTRLHPIDGAPHLILVASRDIEAEEELLYDYGDRSKASVSAHPWLKY